MKSTIRFIMGLLFISLLLCCQNSNEDNDIDPNQSSGSVNDKQLNIVKTQDLLAYLEALNKEYKVHENGGDRTVYSSSNYNSNSIPEKILNSSLEVIVPIKGRPLGFKFSNGELVRITTFISALEMQEHQKIIYEYAKIMTGASADDWFLDEIKIENLAEGIKIYKNNKVGLEMIVYKYHHEDDKDPGFVVCDIRSNRTDPTSDPWNGYNSITTQKGFIDNLNKSLLDFPEDLWSWDGQ